MENIPKPNFNSNSDNNQDIKKIQSEDNSIITNNISEDKKEKENKETKPNNNNEISNNLNENIFINKSKDNLLNFKTSYPLLFK
jgi:hypothetical protein